MVSPPPVASTDAALLGSVPGRGDVLVGASVLAAPLVETSGWLCLTFSVS